MSDPAPLSPGASALLEALKPRVEYEIGRLRVCGVDLSEPEIAEVLGALYVGQLMRQAPGELRAPIKTLFILSANIAREWRGHAARAP